MKTKLLCILFAVVANILLMPLALATPKSAAAASGSGFLFHCCKQTVAGDPYCCGNCCMFTFDCYTDGHCGEE